VLADGKSNWLEGFILICEFLARSTSPTSVLTENKLKALYIIIAVSFWFYPGKWPLQIVTTVKAWE
jgi:hypothetical protein